jgi:hypothetical protein
MNLWLLLNDNMGGRKSLFDALVEYDNPEHMRDKIIAADSTMLT